MSDRLRKSMVRTVHFLQNKKAATRKERARAWSLKFSALVPQAPLLKSCGFSGKSPHSSVLSF